MTEQELKNALKNVREACRSAVIYMRIVNSTLGKQVKIRNEKLTNILTINFVANLIAAIQMTNKVIDSAGMSIQKVLAELEGYPGVVTSKEAGETRNLSIEMKTLLDTKDPLIEKLRKQRNKYHSHLDINLSKANLARDILTIESITFSELDELLETLSMIIDRIENHVNGKTEDGALQLNVTTNGKQALDELLGINDYWEIL